jgi:hypothetical protein
MPTKVKAVEEGAAGAQKAWQLDDAELASLETTEDRWTFIGKYKSHSREVTGLEFGMSVDGFPVLASVGADKRLVEYDLLHSSIEGGVKLRGKRAKIEQSATPTACAWMPMSGGAREQLILTANDEYKLRGWNSENKGCRKTTLAPTFGGPVTRMVPVPSRHSVGDMEGDGGVRGEGELEGGASVGVEAPFLLAYSTSHRVVGLIMLPLDGNPHKNMGLIAHPGEITAMVVGHSGRVMLTAGGRDMSVHLWELNSEAMRDTATAGGVGVEPFLQLLDGGATGRFYQEIKDFFVYAQLRAQGEETTEPRNVKLEVPLAEVPNLMRALGYYPTEADVENLVSEVRYADYTATGELKEMVTLDELVQLYVNHRPVLGVGKSQIEDALKILAEATAGVAHADSMDWHTVSRTLTSKGEALSASELETCLLALTGDNTYPHDVVTVDGLAHEVLGFEGAPATGEAEA